MRLIDADRLLTERMMSKYYHLPNGDIAIPIIDIKHAKTIDAVEVVRCKDCMYCYSDGYCPEIERDVDALFFCEKGYKKI